MFDYKISKHPHFDEACRAFALRHNMAKLAERAGMNVQTLRNKLNPDQPHQLTAPEIWLLTDLTEDSTLVDGFLAQIHCLPCVPINEVAKEKLPHYVMSATAEIGRVAAGAVSGDVKTSAGRRDAISSINSVTRLMALTAVSLQARLQANPAMASAVDTVNWPRCFIRFAVRCLCLRKNHHLHRCLLNKARQCTTVTAGSWVRMENAGIHVIHKMNCCLN